MATTSVPPRLHLRWQLRRDLPFVLAIERAVYGDAAWAEADFLAALRDRHMSAIVTEVGARVVAYSVYRLHEDCACLLNCTVAADYRRRGAATAFLRWLRDRPGDSHRHVLVADVPDTALPMHLLLRAFGFTAGRVLRGGSMACDHYRFVYNPQAVPWDEAAFDTPGGLTGADYDALNGAT